MRHYFTKASGAIKNIFRKTITPHRMVVVLSESREEQNLKKETLPINGKATCVGHIF
ncbi:MAG: hypothetical protein ACRCY4_04645 [Brevinema sp.]